MATIDLSKAIGLSAGGTGYYTTSTSNVTTFDGSLSAYDGEVQRAETGAYTYAANANMAAGQTILATTSVAPWTIYGTTVGDSIVGGQKADTIYIAGADTITGGAGADTIQFDAAGTAVMTDYTYNGTTTGDVFGFEHSDHSAYYAANGVITIDSTTALNISASETNGAYRARFSNGDVWFSGTTGAVLDASAQTGNMLLVGGNNLAADTIKGGSGTDKIFADAGDVVDGGRGTDDIYLSTDAKRETIQLAMTGGTDQVAQFSAGWEDTNDLVELTDGTFSAADAVLESTGSSLYIRDGSSSSTQLNLMTRASNARFLVRDTAGTHTVVAGNWHTIAIGSSAADAEFVIGSTEVSTVLDFTGDAAAAAVDLSNGKGFGDTRQYANIHNVTGGTGKSTLAGSTASDTLTAGAGGSTLWGGAGTAADILTGAAAADVFSYSGSAYKEGNDVIGTTTGTNAFATLDDDNESAATADILNLYDGVMPAAVTKSVAGNVILKYDDNDSLTIDRVADNQTIKFITNGTTHGMKVAGMSAAAQITASTNADYYYGSTAHNMETTLSVTAAAGTTQTVYLDSTHGDANTYVNIATVVGGAGGGSLVLGGSTAADKITAGGTAATIWGGAGTAADSLVGTAGSKDVFFYSADYKEGKDTVTAFAAANDSIDFYDGSTAFTATRAAHAASNDVVFTFDTNDVLTVHSDSADDVAINVMFGTTAAKGVKVAGSDLTGSTLSRVATAQYYFGSTNDTADYKTTLTVAGTAGTTQTVYLDGTHGDSDVYVNINKIDGSKDTVGAKVLGGSTAADTITGGGANASIWGGAGTAADSLVGAAGKDVFFYSGQYAEGQDTISTFDASSDVIDLYDGGVYTVTKAAKDSGNIVLTYDSKNAITLTPTTAQDDTVINVMVGSTKVQGLKAAGSSEASTLTYTSDAAFYYGSTSADTTKQTTLELSSSEDQVVYLDGRSNGEHYENIATVTAANASGTVVIGGSTASDTITGSVNANSSLWGGAGEAADTMAGGTHTGKDMFWYGLGEGNDVITGASAEDTINLYNVDVMTDYKGTYSADTNTMAVQIGSGWLTVTRADNAATVSFVDKNGYTDTYNWTSKTWKSQSNS